MAEVTMVEQPVLPGLENEVDPLVNFYIIAAIHASQQRLAQSQDLPEDTPIPSCALTMQDYVNQYVEGKSFSLGDVDYLLNYKVSFNTITEWRVQHDELIYIGASEEVKVSFYKRFERWILLSGLCPDDKPFKYWVGYVFPDNQSPMYYLVEPSQHEDVAGVEPHFWGIEAGSKPEAEMFILAGMFELVSELKERETMHPLVADQSIKDARGKACQGSFDLKIESRPYTRIHRNGKVTAQQKTIVVEQHPLFPHGSKPAETRQGLRDRKRGYITDPNYVELKKRGNLDELFLYKPEQFWHVIRRLQMIYSDPRNSFAPEDAEHIAMVLAITEADVLEKRKYIGENLQHGMWPTQ